MVKTSGSLTQVSQLDGPPATTSSSTCEDEEVAVGIFVKFNHFLKVKYFSHRLYVVFQLYFGCFLGVLTIWLIIYYREM